MLQTAIYFLCLIPSIVFCYTRPVPKVRLIASLLCIAVTWFLIVRFTVRYNGPNVFDEAYADVIWGGANGNWGYSQMLLTWAVVAMVWSHEAPCAYQFFGVLGAMSASFLVYTPFKTPSSTKLPASYAVAAIVGFLCIWMLPRTSTMEDLSWWLWGLHLALLIPKLLPSIGPQLDMCFTCTLIAALCFVINILSTSSPWPGTDCQISITIDMVVCSGINLCFLREVLEAPSLLIGLCAMLTPILSPGCVLALGAAVQHGLPRRAVTLVQRCAARYYGGSPLPGSEHWMNLGYWGPSRSPADTRPGNRCATTYAAACRQLARLVGDAAGLKKGERLLCVGCGSGSELGLLHEAYKLSKTTGLDADPDAASRFSPNGSDIRFVHGLIEDMGSFRKSGFRHGDFDKILAVDSIYHCNRSRFFHDCVKLLPVGSVVALTDVVLSESAPWWVRLVLRLMNIPWCNHWSKAVYVEQLEAAGLRAGNFASLEPYVLAHWLPSALRDHLDYVLVSASVATSRRRRTVAIIGSGMSGCLVGRRLSETHDVTIFEAGPSINLAGRAGQVDGLTVDVPLRMLGPCYYRTLELLIAELGVPTVPLRFDTCFYSGARTIYVTHESSMRTFFGRLKYLGVAVRLSWAMAVSPPAEDGGPTFGEYMRLHQIADTELYRLCILPQLSWMLSCDLAVVEAYPAFAIVHLLNAGHPLFSIAKSVVRIHPYNKILQDRLVEGLNVKVNTPVLNLGKDRKINGESFDVVVIATEAAAIPKILSTFEWASIFAEFKYCPSSVVLHRDATAMPTDRADWRVINVHVDEKHPGSMLSVWMNAYYGFPEGDAGNVSSRAAASYGFASDVFQTWNPHARPKHGDIIQESNFVRVFHTVESPRLHKAVVELQGRDGFYFAGAYAVPGLGLLEEACRSAEAAAAAIWRDEARQAQHGDSSPEAK